MARKAGKVLGPGEKPEVRSRYAYMAFEEHATWSAFLRSRILKLGRVWYGVYVSTSVKVVRGFEGGHAGDHRRIKRHRIDVVGGIRGKIFIIKVKARVNVAAIREVVTYRNMFLREFEVGEPVQAMIVTRTAGDDMLDIAGRQKVKIIALEGGAQRKGREGSGRGRRGQRDAGSSRLKTRREV